MLFSKKKKSGICCWKKLIIEERKEMNLKQKLFKNLRIIFNHY